MISGDHYATITLEVDVHLEKEFDEGSWDHYFAIREARPVGFELYDDPSALIIVDQGGGEDVDPDGRLVDSVLDALRKVRDYNHPTSPPELTDADEDERIES